VPGLLIWLATALSLGGVVALHACFVGFEFKELRISYYRSVLNADAINQKMRGFDEFESCQKKDDSLSSRPAASSYIELFMLTTSMKLVRT
jgi:hypothetical protein